jgi:hypothetical protein
MSFLNDLVSLFTGHQVNPQSTANPQQASPLNVQSAPNSQQLQPTQNPQGQPSPLQMLQGLPANQTQPQPLTNPSILPIRQLETPKLPSIASTYQQP